MVMWHSRVDWCLSVSLSQSVVRKFILKKRSCFLMLLLSGPLILLGPPAESPRADGHVAQSSGLVLVCQPVAIGSAEVYSEEEELLSDAAAVRTAHSFGTSRGVASSGWSCGTVEWTGACLSACRNR